jgi:hypothetical protein
MKRVARMLKTRVNRTLRWFRHQISNGTAEGFNSRIQSIKSAARRFRAFTNYRLRILFYCQTLDMKCPGRTMTKLSEYLRTAEAADYLGDHHNRIRKWAARGDLPLHRNPVNGYRLFKRSDLDIGTLVHHAIEEYPTQNGPADYALVTKGQLLGVVEAKKLTVGPKGALTQAERYSKGATASLLNFDGFRVPFLYSTNGEVIYFHDVRDSQGISRRILKVAEKHYLQVTEEHWDRAANLPPILSPPSDPDGSRTRVTAVKGRCPRPLDDGAILESSVGLGGFVPRIRQRALALLRHARSLNAGLSLAHGRLDRTLCFMGWVGVGLDMDDPLPGSRPGFFPSSRGGSNRFQRVFHLRATPCNALGG